MADQFLFRFNEEGLDQILRKVEEFRRTIREVGQAGDLGEGFQRFFNQFIAGTRQSTKTLRDLRSQITQIQTELQSARFTSELETLRRGLTQPDVSRDVAELVPGVLQGQQRGAAATERIRAEIAQRVAEATELRAQGEERVRAILEEQARLTSILVSEQERLAQETQRQANVAEYTNRLETNRVNLLNQVRDVQPGGSRLNELVVQRENELLQRQAELREQLNTELARFQQTVPQEASEILSREVQLTQQITQAKERQGRAEREVAAARQAALQAGLGRAQQGAGTATEQERAALLQKQADARQRIAAAQEEELRSTVAVQRLEQERAENLERMAAIESGGTGLSRGATEVLNRLREVNQLIAQISTSSDALGDVFGEGIQQELQQVEQTLASFEGRDVELLGPEEQQELAQAQARARELLQTVNSFPTEGIPLRLNEEELLASQSLLNRVVLGAARDFGRRFTATLQFAISGALLFGAQRVLREFFDAAVEVERTFADISTSLEFDIEAERGTAAFERQLEGVRRQVLQIADDFNALPTEVNQAAFQMISRFSDVEAAMIATRAQVLATRVATIEQGEALRSLTGVAEAYGLALANIEDDQERQRQQAELYAEALDFATAIQQRFGISVEDTLDGAAGLAELFRTLGFSIEETFGIVAATVRRTGQTGAQVSDRLARAFSALATPELRNELLALANQFDEFFLRPVDFFDSGRTAFFKIVDQFQDLDQNLQNRISQIIGQRRETAFISALLQAAGEGQVNEVVDLLDDAAGSAEDRLAILLATVQGTIEGITTEWQELAQNVEALGLITPIRLFLGALELVLKTMNLIITGALNLVEALNRIRIPFIDWGLGDALTTMIALVSAAASLRSLFAAITLAAQSRGASTLIDVVRGMLGFSIRSGGSQFAAGAGQNIGGALGLTAFIDRMRQTDGLFSKFSTGLRTLFIAPIESLQLLLSRVRTTLGAWATALFTGQVATGSATTTEIGLQLARARTAVLNGILTVRTLGLTGILARVGPFLRAVVTRLGGFQQGLLAVAGAALTARAAFGFLESIIERIFGDDTQEQRSVGERSSEIQADAEAAGTPISDAAARVQALNERLGELGEEADSAGAGITSFALSVFGPFLDLLGGREAFPGSTENLRREGRQVELELAFAETQELIAEGDRLRAAAAAAGEEVPEALARTKDSLGFILDSLVDIDAEDPDPEALDDARRLIELVRNVMEESIPEILGEWGEVLTSEQIREEMANLQSQLQLGFETTGHARQRLAELRRNALARLAQSEDGEDPEAIREAERDLLDIALADQRLLQEERDARLARAAIIEDNRAKLLAELQILREHAESLARNPNVGPEAVAEAQRAVQEAEREYNKALEEEAIARLRFRADNAKTFSERIEALQALYVAIQAQIAARKRQAAEDIVPDLGDGIIGNILESALESAIAGVIQTTAEEEAALQAVLDSIADEQLRYAKLVARNSTLRNASALDSVAAAAATVNALRAEIDLMRQREEDEQEILAKEIELRDAIAQQRLAEADRRAAFFRLTAGTGDQVKAAQAELRAAQDRLATIQALDAGDTREGYEAELAVLQARQRLAELALRMADLRRRVNSDLTDSFEQALLDVQAAQEALREAKGEIEKLEAERQLAEAEARAQREFYDRRLSDLDFLFQTDQIGRSQYIAGLRALQQGIDRSTRQGEELWREIELQIRGLMDQADQAFNIPTNLQLPTLFEVRRSLQADALGVNYQDMRQQEINVFVSDEVDAEAVAQALNDAFGSNIDIEAQRLASGGAGITIGGFN